VTLRGTRGKSAFKKGSISRAVAMPRSSCIRCTLPRSRRLDGVRRSSLERSTSGSSPPAVSPSESPRSLFFAQWCCRSCLLFDCWRSAASLGLALFSYSSASRIFIMQPGCSPPPVVIQKDDHQPRGGEKRAGLRPPSCPQLQGCSSSSLGWKASRAGVLPSAWAGDPLLPPAFGGEGRSPALQRRGTSATWGQPAAGTVSCRVPSSWPRWLWCRLRRCLLPFGRSVAVRPPHGRRSCHAWVCHIHGLSRAAGRTGGSYKTPYAAGITAAFLDGLVLTRVGGWERGPLRARWGSRRPSVQGLLPPLVRLPIAEVVASAGETIRASCRRVSDSLALMALLSPPVGGWGRGPPRNGAHPEVAADAGKPLGAEVVVAAGAEVVAVAGEPSVQRWLPPLVRLPGASFQRDSCWCSVVHSCRNGARAPLVRECNNICLLESRM
jgi:hypothetical protein